MQERELLVETLNAVHLPPRFTAIYHRDLQQLEFIYEFLENSAEVLERSFQFNYRSRNYSCRFGRSSDRLLTIARHFRPTRPPSDTRYRNLIPFRDFQRTSELTERVRQFFEGRVPTCFLVGGIDVFDEHRIIDLCSHLNFYLRYYDRRSSIIIIHKGEEELPARAPLLRYIRGTFPSVISGRQLEPSLLRLIEAGHEEVSARMSFLYYFQILEYAAFYFVRDDVRQDIRRILSTPDIAEGRHTDIDRLVDLVSANLRMSDDDKLVKTVETRCEPTMIWPEVENLKESFTVGMEFDGGFSLPALIPDNCTSEIFCNTCIPNTVHTLRKIRNALVHARETHTGTVISPTNRNERLLRPWVPLLRRIAEEVILHDEV